MNQKKFTSRRINLQEIFSADKDSFKELLREEFQEVLEQEMTETIGGLRREKGVPSFLGYRPGCYSRSLVTRVGKTEL